MNRLYGAILGDLAGQPYEFGYKGDYSEFDILDPKSTITDDTLMTLASASHMLGMYSTFERAYKEMGARYDGDYYGKRFRAWLKTPYDTISGSWGNGCLMRISPYMYYHDKTTALNKVIGSCLCSHNHEKSIIACYKLFELYEQSGMRRHASKYNVKLDKFEHFEVAADKTFAFIKNAYWYSNNTHYLIKRVIECGGDTDTNASIIGELMNWTFNDLTKDDIDYVESKLDPYLLTILHNFNKTF